MRDIEKVEQALQEAQRQINTIHDNIEINTIVEEIISQLIGSQYASIWTYKAPFLIRERADAGIQKVSMKEKQGLLYYCFSTKRAGVYNALNSTQGFVEHIDNPDNIPIRSKIMIPLVQGENFVGIVTAYCTSKSPKEFSNDDFALFQAITPFVINAISIMERNKHLSKQPLAQYAGEQELKTNLKHFKDRRKKDRRAGNEQQQKMLNNISNVVHDIRTPTNGLLGFLEILEEHMTDEKLKSYINHAKESAQFINELTTTLLDARTDPDILNKTDMKMIATNKFFADIAEMFSANMYQKNISYNIFIDPLLPKEFKVNHHKLKRIIMNLIGNAVKFTPEYGCIEFSVRYKQKEKKLHIYIKDSGIGIAKEKQSQIFEAFKQAEESTKKLYGGTGLGLSICAAYVHEMGGKLLVQSELNKGSTFYFDLPMEMKDYPLKFNQIKEKNLHINILMHKKNLHVANHILRYLVKLGVNVDQVEAISSTKQLTEETTHLIVFQNQLDNSTLKQLLERPFKTLMVEEEFLSLSQIHYDLTPYISQYQFYGEELYSFISSHDIPRVLIVEDDRISILLIKTILENEYCQIDVAKNGVEGLEMLLEALKAKKAYNIVFSDYQMPFANGVDMLRQYKEQEKRFTAFRTKTVLISGDKLEIQGKNIFDVAVNKPFQKKEILTIFKEAVSDT